MTKIDRYLPFIISILLPGMSLLSLNSLEGVRPSFELADVIQLWIISSFAILGIWFINAWAILGPGLKKRVNSPQWNLLVILTANALYIGFFMVLMRASMAEIVPVSQPLFMVAPRFGIVSLIFAAIQRGIKAVRDREDLNRMALSLKAENMEAKFELLKRQINPHFLFNSLNTLRTMVRSGDRASEEYILHLSDMYRQILNKRDSSFASLKEELDFLDSYLFMLRVRHKEGLQVEINVDPDSVESSLPTFSLQLLVENCIKHNIVSASKPLHVVISLPSKDEIRVENNFQPKSSKEVNSSGIGLANLRERYKLLGISDGVDVRQESGKFTVTLKLVDSHEYNDSRR